ncbi:MAG: TonB-dependent receptor [Vicinamibacteraceae bacterium]
MAAALFRIPILTLLVIWSPDVAALALAQQTVSLTGHVYDSSGSALPGVAVTVSGDGVRTVFTDENGRYHAPDLATGAYDIVAELGGFKTARRAATLSADSASIDLTLELAGIAESVIVRGARTSRSLMDTPASVTVFDAAALERRPLRNGTSDLLAQIPNVTASGTNNFAPAVRGADGTGPAQGADAFFAGTRPRLNIQVDGRPASYNEVVFGDVGLWDVEQVEIFRGAQSTVQGRNALAGTLAVKTKDPTYRPEAKVRVGAGNLGTRQVSGVVSGPIIDGRLAGRFAFDRGSSDSFVEGFQSFQGVEQPGAFDSLTLRGKLFVEPDAARRFSTLVTINHTDVTGPQTEGVLRPFGEHATSYAAMPVFEPETTGIVAESRWTLNGRVGYEQTLAFTDLHIERKALPGDGNAAIDGHELVFEPRVRFATEGRRVQGFAGVYLFRGRQDEAIDLFGGGTFDDETDTVAAFGELTIAMPKRFEVTLAGRVEREHRRRTGATGPFSIDLDETYDVFSPKVGLEWHASDTVAVGAFVLRGYNGGGAGFTYDPPFVSYTFDPELVWSSESYVRADLGGGTLSLTGNVFFSRYADMQLPFDLNPDPRMWSFVVRNADAAVTYGSELGATWRPAASLELFGNVGLLHAEITEYPGSGVEGHRPAQAPSFTTDFGASYRHSGGFDVSFDTRFSDSYFSSVTNDPLGKTDPYAILNVQAGYTIRGTRVFALVGNLFDSAAMTLLEPGATRAEDVAQIVRPRHVGVGVTWEILK